MEKALCNATGGSSRIRLASRRGLDSLDSLDSLGVRRRPVGLSPVTGLAGVRVLGLSRPAAALSAVVAGVAIRAMALSAVLAVVMPVLVLRGWLVAPFVVLAEGLI